MVVTPAAVGVRETDSEAVLAGVEVTFHAFPAPPAEAIFPRPTFREATSQALPVHRDPAAGVSHREARSVLRPALVHPAVERPSCPRGIDQGRERAAGTRPSQKPSGGTKPPGGTAETRPGGKPSQLPAKGSGNFLGAAAGVGAGAALGGAIANRPSQLPADRRGIGERPTRPEQRPNWSDRSQNRDDQWRQRVDNRSEAWNKRSEQRQERRDQFQNNRDQRWDNLESARDDRQEWRDQRPRRLAATSRRPLGLSGRPCG